MYTYIHTHIHAYMQTTQYITSTSVRNQIQAFRRHEVSCESVAQYAILGPQLKLPKSFNSIERFQRWIPVQDKTPSTQQLTSLVR